MGRAYRRLLETLAAIAALLLGAMALAVSADVVLRNVGLGAAPWILELSEYVLPLATFLIAPSLLLRGEHIRLDALLRALPAPAARGLDVAVNALGLAISGVLFLYGVRAALDSARQGAMIFKSVVFPEWWLYAPFSVCFALLAIEFVRRVVVRETAAPSAGPRA
jgi:TRAP-type C4-dicarboxylate transport system permease small subunit